MAFGVRARSASGFCFTAWENDSVALLSERSGLRRGLDRARGLSLVAFGRSGLAEPGRPVRVWLFPKPGQKPKPGLSLHVFGASPRHPALVFFSARSYSKFCESFLDLQQLDRFVRDTPVSVLGLTALRSFPPLQILFLFAF